MSIKNLSVSLHTTALTRVLEPETAKSSPVFARFGYVLHQEGAQLETDGPGLGYIDIYSSSGRLLQRLEHGDWLNAPWGVALAPLDFGRFSHDLLIGQFAGAGDPSPSASLLLTTWRPERLADCLKMQAGSRWPSMTLTPGNVSPTNNDAAGAPTAEIYFTAGPNHGSGGLLGYLTAVSTELTEGNSQ